MIRSRLSDLARDERGTSMVELAIAIPLFLLVLLGTIDFARFYYHFSASEKALADAARIASVRPPVCPSAPTSNNRGSANANAVLPEYGVGCSEPLFDASGNVVSGSVCSAQTQTCDLAETGGATATADEIWRRLGPALPTNATRTNVEVSYAFDSDLNFLGGPYVPNVSVRLTGIDFNFIAPIGPLASMAGASSGTFGQSTSFPSLRAVAPGEDLAAGNDG